MRTYWLSFCDNDKPKGEQFIGVVVVDVTDDDAALVAVLRPDIQTEEGMWIGAAVTAAWNAGVNPGGEVALMRIDGNPAASLYPRLQLLSREDIERLEPATP